MEFKLLGDTKWCKYKEYNQHEKFKGWKLDINQKNKDIDDINLYLVQKWKGHFEAHYCYIINDLKFQCAIMSDSEFFNTITKYINSDKIKESLRFLMEDKQMFNLKIESIE